MIWIVLGVIFILFLVVASAFFSGAEMAFISVSRASIADKARAGDHRAHLLVKLLRDPGSVISAIIVGNNLVNILASILAGWLATNVFGDAGVGIATAVMFFTLLVFSEATPKAFGIQNESLALRVARPLVIVTKVFHPITVLLTKISGTLLHVLGRPRPTQQKITEREIMAMMKLGEEEGTIAKDEREMVREVFEFDETMAYEVYTPKDKVVFVQADAPASSLKDLYLKTKYSRFPVYLTNLDDIVGMVHVKDLFGLADLSLPVRSIMRSILIINSRMKVDDVLREMKRRHTHLALLKDASGKTLGLVSMEDLIEEVFGDIADEHD